jgi:hypothetical protein
MTRPSSFAARAAVVWFVVLGAFGCSETVQSSTEVENEIAARALQGSAMDSVALDSASWTAWDATGAVIGTGLTDSTGRFSIQLARVPSGGLLVRVVRRGDTLRALAALDTSVVRSAVATVQVNPLTEAAIPPGLGDPSRGIAESLFRQAATRGQRLLDTCIGIPLPWRDVAADPTFRALSPVYGGTPSMLSGLVRAVVLSAARDSLDVTAWLARRQAEGEAAVVGDSLFAIDFAGSLAALRLPWQQTLEYVRRTEAISGTDGALESAWLDHPILADLAVRAIRLPWAVDSRYQAMWQRLVEATADPSAEYENGLPSQNRAFVRNGRSHEILAEAVGELIVPDTSSNQSVAKAALDTFLLRIVPQALLLLDRLRPEAWGSEPNEQSKGQDPIALLIASGLNAGFSSSWNYVDFQKQTQPGAWISSRYHVLASPSEAADSLASAFKAHPPVGLASDALK